MKNKSFKKLFTSQESLIFGALLVIVAIFCLYPFLGLFQKVVTADGEFSFKYFSKVLSSKSTLKAFYNTMLVCTGTAALSSLISLPIAWLLKRSDLPGSKNFKTLFSLPYAIPPYIGAIAWIYLANPTNGLLNETIFGKGFLNIYSLGGLVFVMSSFFYTLTLLNLLVAFDRIDPSLEEAARISGASPLKVFFKITLPLITPSLLSGFLLVFLASAASFGVPALVGSPADIYLLTTKIYTLQKMGSMSGIYQAGALSITLLGISILLIAANIYVQKKFSFQTISGKSPRASVYPLGKFKKLIVAGSAFFLFVIFGLPLISILLSSLSPVQGKLSLGDLTFQNYIRVLFEMSETPRAFTNSFILAISAATIGTFVGFIISFMSIKTRMAGRKVIPTIASIPYTTPGTVVALALILSFSQSFLGLPISLYNTMGLLVIAYVVKYLSLSINVNGDALAQIDDCLSEAARVSGANWIQTIRYVWLPLLKNSLFAGWFLILMPVFSELTMTILLAGPGMETIGTFLFQLQEYSDASGGGAAVISIFVILIVITLNAAVKKMSKGAYGL